MALRTRSVTSFPLSSFLRAEVGTFIMALVILSLSVYLILARC